MDLGLWGENEGSRKQEGGLVTQAPFWLRFRGPCEARAPGPDSAMTDLLFLPLSSLLTTPLPASEQFQEFTQFKDQF